MKSTKRTEQRYLLAAFSLLFVYMLLMTRQAQGAAITDIKTVVVTGGCFMMGDQAGSGGYDERPVHEVCVDDFRMGVFEVTEEQWYAVMASDLPLHSGHGPGYPANGVSWSDVREYITRLNRRSGLNYRLPTEAEWEYAARSGGKLQMYSGSNDEKTLADYACSRVSCSGTALPVGQKKPNALGLYDMSGNAWEWVQDRYDPYYYRQSPKNNPQGDPFGINRILRGGGSDSVNGQLRTSYREYLAPTVRRDGVGFRLLLPGR
ncbi:MAG TPA: SUMF1/EgtB/PvdO family nonheme iron enzyme [Desulfuromonadales bacterium]|nr:SUMF1/EgtB/PvdO family nonheme iron enzyme [Desulfuromonadales bacterium]